MTAGSVAAPSTVPAGVPPQIVQGTLNEPAEGAVVLGTVVRVVGWVLIDGRPPAVVEVEVGGAAPVRARISLPRTDVVDVLGGRPDALMCGYEARVPVPVAPGESRRITVRVSARDRQGTDRPIATRVCTIRARGFDPQEIAISERAAAFSARLLQAVPLSRTPDHLLVFTHSLRVGGGELWLLELLEKLVRTHGFDVTVVAPTDGQLRPELEALGVGVWLTGDHDITRPLTYQAYVSELALIARASGAGCVLVNTLGVFAGVDAALRAELPVAWVIHESYSLPDFALLNWGPDGLAPSVRQRWEECLAAADALLFVADSTRELFVRHSAPRKCLTIKYGIDMTSLAWPGSAHEIQALRREHGIDDAAQVVLSVGISEPRKGHTALLVAFKRVRRRYPGAHLVIVGIIDSPYRQAIHRWVVDSGLESCVSLVPVVREPRAYFQLADLFVNSSDIESLPRSIIEAIAFGVPVLAADVFGARDLVVDGTTGWLCASNDANALAAGLIRALDTPVDERLRMAERATLQISDFLDSAGYGEQYAALLGRLSDPEPVGMLTAVAGGAR